VTALLITNAATSLIVGMALLMVWRRDPEQAFAGHLGWAGVADFFGPLGYLAWRSGDPAWHTLGATVLVVADTAYLTLLAWGLSELAGRPLRHGAVLALATALAIVQGGLLMLNPRLAQGVHASLNVAAGALALLWLWSHRGAERWAGALLVLMGLNQFGYAIGGEAALQLQLSVGSMLRVGLGLAILYAAVSRTAAQAARLRDRFAQMTQHSHQGVAVMRGEHVLYANPALLRMYGLSTPEQLGARWRDATIPEADRAQVRERHRRLMSGEIERDDWEGLRYRLDGTPMRLRFSGWRIDWDGEPAEQVVATDETEVRNATQALLYRATHDELTGLPNRSALLQRLRELCAREGQPGFALVLLDVDRFKLFNDAQGHSLGDEVLKVLARQLQAQLPSRVEVMRLGEDEFALLAPNAADERAAREIAHQVRVLLTRPLSLARHEFFIDVSMGIALFPMHGREAEPLLRSATAALREAKRTPGTSHAFAESRFERGSSEVLAQEQALRAGIKNEEFSLVYQPKVDARDGTLLGFEALARWDRPGLGRIGPQQFVPAAERTGLIGPLGNLILTQACHQIAEWRSAFSEVVPVAVNVSPLQLLDPAFPELVERTLEHFHVPARLLTLEITESAAVTHLEQAVTRIHRMRELGVQVALDDFGTGFSSLNMLRSLPLQTVKIDRSLIDPMPAPDATAVVQAICTLAKVLGLTVVAEGVESPDHAQAAQAAGCHALQGFLYSEPVAPDVAARWIVQGRVMPHAHGTQASPALG
jgi:diguanylate cyclase (GGDEF)-like protein/PAS domain S-box-containing protein